MRFVCLYRCLDFGGGAGGQLRQRLDFAHHGGGAGADAAAQLAAT